MKIHLLAGLLLCIVPAHAKPVTVKSLQSYCDIKAATHGQSCAEVAKECNPKSYWPDRGCTAINVIKCWKDFGIHYKGNKEIMDACVDALNEDRYQANEPKEKGL